MGTILNTDDDDFTAYKENWEKTHNEFFKLEALPVYQSDLELEEYKLFHQGELSRFREMTREALLQDPGQPYQKIAERGVDFIRVHVVELPLTPYLEFEIASYEVSLELGEKIYFISKEDAADLSLPTSLQDFLMFDESIVHLQFLNPESGEWQYTELLDEPEEVQEFVETKKKLLEHAKPMHDFLELHGIQASHR